MCAVALRLDAVLLRFLFPNHILQVALQSTPSEWLPSAVWSAPSAKRSCTVYALSSLSSNPCTVCTLFPGLFAWICTFFLQDVRERAAFKNSAVCRVCDVYTCTPYSHCILFLVVVFCALFRHCSHFSFLHCSHNRLNAAHYTAGCHFHVLPTPLWSMFVVASC